MMAGRAARRRLRERFFAECFPDKTLLVALGAPHNDVVHLSGRSRIGKRLQEDENKIALVDEDPGKSASPYFRDTEFQEADSKHGIRINRDEARSHVIFVICPEMEGWVIKTCKNLKIDMLKHYNLPPDENRLHDVFPARLPNFARLLRDLLAEDRDNPVKWLQSQLAILGENSQV